MAWYGAFGWTGTSWLVVTLYAMSSGFVGEAQSTKAPQQPLYLPDPTPRNPDPHLVLGDNPVDRARREQAVALQMQQLRARAVGDVKEILTLASQLQDRAAHPDGGPPAPLDRMAAQKIERLAKDLRTTMQTR